MALPVYVVDAFADRPMTGNPAAVVPLETWLPEAVMQAIAAEMNLSETVFFAPHGDGFDIRWFTPTLEVDLVGHATLAAGWVAFNRLAFKATEARFIGRAGSLTVSRKGSGEAALLSMEMPARIAKPCRAPPELARALGAAPVEALAATHYLCVFADASVVRGLKPDMNLLASLDKAAVIVTAHGDVEFDFVSRFFAPANGVPEDPVSGVSHCSLVPYWSRRLGKKNLVGRQVSQRGGTLVCEDRGDRITLDGTAALFLEGTLSI